MLKLIRVKNDLHITLREKEKTSLLFAFTIALFLHITAIFIFNVHPIKSTQKEIILPPIIVNAEIQGDTVIANLDEAIQHFPFETKPPEPQIPPLNPSKDHLYLFAMEEIPHLWEDPFPAPNLDLPQTMPPVIRISGPLSETPLLHHHIPPYTKSFHQIFQVRVDNSSGKIFWFQPANSIAEAIFDTMLFATDAGIFVTQGEIELYLQGEPS